MAPVVLAGIISAAASLAKAGIGAAQGAGGRRRQDELWMQRPQIGITAGEKLNDNLYRQMASATELPGERQRVDRMNEAVSSGIYDAQRSANSSLGATQAAVDLNAKKISAIQDLAGAFSEYKARNMERLAAWNSEKSDLELQRFDINKYRPWNIRMNEAVSNKQAGWASFGGGMDSGLGMLNTAISNNELIKMYQGLYGNNQ